MRSVFADTSYWLALLNPRDTLHARVKSLYSSLDGVRLVTSEMVLTELLNDFAGRGEALRTTAVRAVERLREETQVFIAPQTSPLFREAFVLYSTRGDKDWSQTDCASFRIMEDHGITEALTHDRHFEQAGFVALLREERR
ncbi:MAG TPA: PIN domain-containing protein [Thermoanaerobaculia bacterium]|nr:PIN domain-containing protein [Thermoanaerobaculia bacterium]